VSTERPILFSDAMVRAILSGAKTQTRRLVCTTRRVRGEAYAFDQDRGLEPCEIHGTPWLTERKRPEAGATLITSPYGYSGDRLWVREAWAPLDIDYRPQATRTPELVDVWTHIACRADHQDPKGDGPAHPMKWRPGIHMPRWASRLTLEVTDVRVERLQDITEADILAEGVTVDVAAKLTGIPWSSLPTLHHGWQAVWDSINADRAPWASNPWVWVVSFRKAA
jgi:hypothetical protein